MNSIINNGVTIIKMPPEPDKKEYSKTGVPGVYTSDGKMRLEVGCNGKRYYFGVQKSLDDARKIRELADLHIEAGTFEEWYKENQHKYVQAQAKHGIKGLTYVKARNRYQLYIYVDNERFFIDSFNDVDAAAIVRAEADKQVENGTFHEWYKLYKFNIKNKKKG